MMNAVFRRLSQGGRHVQGPDRQIPFHAVADGPTDDTARVKVDDNGEIQPALTGPDARVSDLLCMSNLSHASLTKEHDNDDDFQGRFRRAAERG